MKRQFHILISMPSLLSYPPSLQCAIPNNQTRSSRRSLVRFPCHHPQSPSLILKRRRMTPIRNLNPPRIIALLMLPSLTHPESSATQSSQTSSSYNPAPESSRLPQVVIQQALVRGVVIHVVEVGREGPFADFLHRPVGNGAEDVRTHVPSAGVCVSQLASTREIEE